jgi:ATP-binding cassette, subfamily B, multidrug efflux pump
MSYYLWEMRPYFRQVAGQLVLCTITGIIMNTAVVLPAILLGQAINAAQAFERGDVGPSAVGWAALAFVGGTLLTEGFRMAKRWWLMTVNGRIRANIRGDALRGVIAWPMARLDRTPVGDVMARIIGDVEVRVVSLREFTIETWDTVLCSLSLVVAMLVYRPASDRASLAAGANGHAAGQGDWPLSRRPHHGVLPSQCVSDHGASGAVGR